MEATTEEAVVGTTETDGDVGVGEAPEQQADSTATESQPSSDEGAEASSALDLSFIPDEVARAQVTELLQQKDKEWKANFTRKSQEYADVSKATEARMQQIQNEYSQMLGLAQEVLKDPSKLEAYRQVYGYAGDAQQSQEFQAPETVEDLIAMYDQKLAAREQALQSKFNDTLTTTLARERENLAWDNALTDMRTDADFKKWEPFVVNILRTDPSYKARHAQGVPHKQLLSDALTAYKDMLRPELENVKQATLNGLKQKKAATTSRPNPSGQTDNSPTKNYGRFSSPLDDPNEVAKAIERAKARLSS